MAAFFIRLIYIIQAQSNPTFYYPMVDELWHLDWAKEIANGNFWGDEAYFRGPLYPYMLALFLKITGQSLFWTRFIQIIIASGSAVFVYLLGEKTSSKKVGIIAGFAYAAYGTLIFYESMLLIPVLFIFLNLLAVYLLIKTQGQNRPLKWLICGIILGLSAIARPNILLLAPLFMIWIYLGLKEISLIKRKIFIVAIYLAGILIPVFSVTLRNYLVTGETILISSQGGVNFYIGNNPDAEGLTMLMPEIKLDESLPWDEFTAATKEAAENEVGRSLSPAEESSFWTGKTLKFIWHNPGKFISLTFKKTVYFMLGFENSDQADIYQSRAYSSIYSLLLWKKIIYFPYGLVFPLAVVGMIALWPGRKVLSLFYIFIIGYLPTIVLFLVTARHRLPVIPFMLLFAAGGLIAFIDFIKKRNWQKVGIFSGIFLVLLIFSNNTYFDIGFENQFQTHFNMGITYERQGNLPAAEREYRKALEENPYSVTCLNNLGVNLYHQNKLDQAQKFLEQAISYDSKSAGAYNNIGLIYEKRANYSQAIRFYQKAISLNPNLYQAQINIGDILMAQQQFEKSEEAYKTAMQVAPKAPEVYFKLGGLYARMSDFAQAEKMFTEGSKYGSPGPADYVNWANVYYMTRKPGKAIEKYHSAIAGDSSLTQAYFGLALTFENFGYPKDSALTYLNQLMKINPDFPPAHQLLQKIRMND